MILSDHHQQLDQSESLLQPSGPCYFASWCLHVHLSFLFLFFALCCHLSDIFTDIVTPIRYSTATAAAAGV